MTSTPLYRTRPTGFDILPAHGSEAIRINDFVWLSEGLSNSYLVVTSEGRVVVNTGMGFEAPVHKRLFDAVDRGPIRWILLTQGHVDHVGGVDHFREAGTEIVAQAGHRAQQSDDARLQRFRVARSAFAFADAIARAARFARSGTEAAGGTGQSRPEPTITFADRYAFELGGLRFDLLATPGGETLDSMVVWLPQHRICFAGNLFGALFGHFPNLVTLRGDRYREAPRFLDSLDRVLALEPELLLVGHHGPVHGGELVRSELLRLRDAVQYVHDETVKGMNAGKNVHVLMREIRLPPRLEVGEGYGKVSWGVRAIWETYAGWFHHRSTTELYPVPHSSVYSDLVTLAGGPDAVAECAGEKVAAGVPVEGLHLAEAALAADPRHRRALEVSVAAHRMLLEASENFWETAWLRRQLQRLEATLAEV